MLFRSTGLGKTELTAHIDEEQGIKRIGDYLVMYVSTTDPVRWKIRAAISYKDLLVLVKVALKLSTIAWVLGLAKAFRPAKHPGDF
jgi:hypothetical protein